MQLAECKMSLKKWCSLPLFSHVQCQALRFLQLTPPPHTLEGSPSPWARICALHGLSAAIPTPSTSLCFQTTGSRADSFRTRCPGVGAAAAASSFRRGACHVCGLAHKSQPWPALPIRKQRGGLIALEALKAHRLFPFSYTSNVISLPRTFALHAFLGFFWLLI